MADQRPHHCLAPSAPSPFPASLKLTVQERQIKNIWKIAGFEENDTNKQILAEKIGSLPRLNAIYERDATLIAATAPMEWLVLTNDEAVSTVMEAIDRQVFALTDLSGARRIFDVSGEHAAIKLSKGPLIDFAEKSFRVGTLKQTSLHHIACMIMRTHETRFQLVTMRSFADDLEAWLRQA